MSSSVICILAPTNISKVTKLPKTYLRSDARSAMPEQSQAQHGSNRVYGYKFRPKLAVAAT